MAVPLPGRNPPPAGHRAEPPARRRRPRAQRKHASGGGLGRRWRRGAAARRRHPVDTDSVRPETPGNGTIHGIVAANIRQYLHMLPAAQMFRLVKAGRGRPSTPVQPRSRQLDPPWASRPGLPVTPGTVREPCLRRQNLVRMPTVANPTSAGGSQHTRPMLPRPTRRSGLGYEVVGAVNCSPTRNRS